VFVPVLGNFRRYLLSEMFSGENCTPATQMEMLTDPYIPKLNDTVSEIKYYNQNFFSNTLYKPGYQDAYPRLNYYKVTAIPHCFIGGQFAYLGISNASVQAWKDSINHQKHSNTPFAIKTTEQLFPTENRLHVHVEITGNGNIAGLLRLRVAINQRNVDIPVGASIKTHFINTFQKMLPNSNGLILKNAWGTNEKQEFDFDWKYGTLVKSPYELQAIAFIQEDYSQYVYQVGPAEVAPKPTDSTPTKITQTKLYPNPAKDKIALAWYAGLNDHYTADIYNSISQLIAHEEGKVGFIGNKVLPFNTANYAPGMYFLNFELNGEKQTFKFIVQ
jgi:hypothetical protein